MAGSHEALFALGGVLTTGIGAVAGAYIKGLTDRKRIEQVEAPASAADAWAAVFEVTHQTMLDLRADVARLEQRLNDQDEEHRVEIIEKDRVIAARELALQNCNDALRRLRSYAAIITDLLAKNNIPFPPPPEDISDIAPERRSPMPGVVAVVDDNPERPSN